MTNPLDHQVGGDHYSKYKIQPVECINRLGLDFCSGNILKYLVRYKDKNGIEDLKKAKHYAELLLEKTDQDTQYFKEFLDQFEDSPIREAMCYLLPNSQPLLWITGLIEGTIMRLQNDTPVIPEIKKETE